MAREKKLKRPEFIAGERVIESGEPMVVKGELWHTLLTEDGEDERIWEWSETTGRIIQTQ